MTIRGTQVYYLYKNNAKCIFLFSEEYLLLVNSLNSSPIRWCGSTFLDPVPSMPQSLKPVHLFNFKFIQTDQCMILNLLTSSMSLKQ